MGRRIHSLLTEAWHFVLLVAAVGLAGVSEAASQAALIHEQQAGLSTGRKKEFRRDDVLYGGGVLLIGLAVLIGYAFAWSGTPPASPFG